MSTRGGMIYLTVWVSSSVNCLFMSFEEFLFCVIFSLLLIGFLGICCKLEEGLHLSGLILQSDEMSLQLTLLISLPILFVSLEWIISFWNEKYKAMAPHSSTLAWKIPWTEEPGRLQSTGSLRVGHDWATSLSLFTLMHWRRKWQPTPVFLPGESQGQRSPVGCRLWGHTESDTTEAT